LTALIHRTFYIITLANAKLASFTVDRNVCGLYEKYAGIIALALHLQACDTFLAAFQTYIIKHAWAN